MFLCLSFVTVSHETACFNIEKGGGAGKRGDIYPTYLARRRKCRLIHGTVFVIKLVLSCYRFRNDHKFVDDWLLRELAWQ